MWELDGIGQVQFYEQGRDSGQAVVNRQAGKPSSALSLHEANARLPVNRFERQLHSVKNTLQVDR